MKNLLIYPFLFFIAFALVKSDWFKCPNPDPIVNFDSDKFLGKWYIVQETKGGVVDRICPSIVVKRGKDDFTFSILLKQRDFIWNKVVHIKIEATLMGNYSSQVQAKFEGSAKLLTLTRYYTIVDTDYENYAVVWGCYKILGIPNQTVFLLGRKSTLSDEITHHAFDLLDSLNLDRKRLETTVQDSCFDM